MIKPDNIAVYSQDDLFEQARNLAKQLNLPLLKDESSADQYQFLLTYQQQGADFLLELQFPGENLNPVSVNFYDPKLQHRIKFGGGRQQAIAKAVGLKRGYNPVIFDGTAGLGRDGFILASLGCEVTMCERNPVIHALLADGLRRLHSGSNAKNLSIKLHAGQSLEFLGTNLENFDVIYLDPMYPHRTKSALVKKEMRILRKLVGDDTDFDKLLEIALKTAKQRVVIKRPKTAPPIGQVPPTHSIESRKTRFDVYITDTLRSQPSKYS